MNMKTDSTLPPKLFKSIPAICQSDKRVYSPQTYYISGYSIFLENYFNA